MALLSLAVWYTNAIETRFQTIEVSTGFIDKSRNEQTTFSTRWVTQQAKPEAMSEVWSGVKDSETPIVNEGEQHGFTVLDTTTTILNQEDEENGNTVLDTTTTISNDGLEWHEVVATQTTTTDGTGLQATAVAPPSNRTVAHRLAIAGTARWGKFPTKRDDETDACMNETTVDDGTQGITYDQNTINCTALRNGERWHMLQCGDACRRRLAVALPAALLTAVGERAYRSALIRDIRDHLHNLFEGNGANEISFIELLRNYVGLYTAAVNQVAIRTLGLERFFMDYLYNMREEFSNSEVILPLTERQARPMTRWLDSLPENLLPVNEGALDIEGLRQFWPYRPGLGDPTEPAAELEWLFNQELQVGQALRRARRFGQQTEEFQLMPTIPEGQILSMEQILYNEIMDTVETASDGAQWQVPEPYISSWNVITGYPTRVPTPTQMISSYQSVRVSPSLYPTEEPVADPTPEPTAEPSPDPTADPTAHPTALPTAEPNTDPITGPDTVPIQNMGDQLGNLIFLADGSFQIIGYAGWTIASAAADTLFTRLNTCSPVGGHTLIRAPSGQSASSGANFVLQGTLTMVKGAEAGACFSEMIKQMNKNPGFKLVEEGFEDTLKHNPIGKKIKIPKHIPKPNLKNLRWKPVKNVQNAVKQVPQKMSEISRKMAESLKKTGSFKKGWYKPTQLMKSKIFTKDGWVKFAQNNLNPKNLSLKKGAPALKSFWKKLISPKMWWRWLKAPLQWLAHPMRFLKLTLKMPVWNKAFSGIMTSGALKALMKVRLPFCLVIRLGFRGFTC
ncbi:hypothetical protein E4T43_07767 [Aureobasidium subglaciale]|nr:hypothetical protein E4T43_07767 [Aureobasidium subglaciale]